MTRRCKECGEEHAVVYLNGRLAVDWEIPIVERARKCERDRDLEQLAGILTGEQPRVAPQETDLAQVHAQLRGRRTITSLDLDVLS